ncbi:MAG: SGNH/GDSL hydrolase family protein [Candidatus Hodarchaeota archaeon]
MKESGDSDLPRVLLIGDSIRMHYAPLVKKKFDGRVEIVEIPENGGDSGNIKVNLDKWLKLARSESLSIIHFNCGLHDIKRQFNQETNQQPIESYEINLKEIVAHLKEKTKAKLIWATTTPVMYERHHARKGFDRFEEDVEQYNEVATSIMQENNIPINDLNKVIKDDIVHKCLRPDGVHMKKRGNKLLANAVVEFLKSYL